MSVILQSDQESFLYQQVMSLVRQMQADGALRAGDKLPSLRKLSAQLGISIPTVKQAYVELESQGVVEARAKSGYFLKAKQRANATPKRPSVSKQPRQVRCQSLIEETFAAVHAPANLPLGVAHPILAHSPDKTLARIMRQVMAKEGAKAMAYGPMAGYEPLRRQLAQRYLEQGVDASSEDIVITNGAQEALAIALQAVARPGDVIAVESPTYFGVLELIENLDMMACEIPSSSEYGICLDDLEKALKKGQIKACLCSSLINNPTGSLMPEQNREKLVAICESYGIPLIADDVYSELAFDANARRQPLARFSTKGLVLTCSSFSKTAAPSYRVGWVFNRKYEEKLKGLKRAFSCSASLLNQQVLNEFVRSGSFDRNLTALRRELQLNKERMLAAISRYFGQSIRVSNPQGGCVLWLELANGGDSIALFRHAVKRQISITPGPLFSANKGYKPCFRLSYGLPWNQNVELAVKDLAELSRMQY